MTTILLNNIPLDLPADLSFSYTKQNPAFGDTEGFTLNITVPLTAHNCELLGAQLYRIGETIPATLLPAAIQTESLYIEGAAILTAVTDTTADLQFLDGQTLLNQNDPFSQIYVDELDLSRFGRWEWDSNHNGEITHYSKRVNYEGYGGSNILHQLEGSYLSARTEFQVLPWLNNHSGIIQNWPYASTFDSQDPYTNFCSIQVYMIPLLKEVCAQLGYTENIDEALNDEPWGNLIVMNAIPSAWIEPDDELRVNYAWALPHWTVSEFFRQWGLLLKGTFAINHDKQTVTFRTHAVRTDDAGSFTIENRARTFKAKQQDEKDCKHINLRNYKYASSNLPLYAYYNCPDFIRRVTADTNDTGCTTDTYYQNDVIHSYADTAYIVCPHDADPADYASPLDRQIFIYRTQVAGGSPTRYYCLRRKAITACTKQEAEAGGVEYSLLTPAERDAADYYKITYFPYFLNIAAPHTPADDGQTEEIKILPALLDLGETGKQNFLCMLDPGEYPNDTNPYSAKTSVRTAIGSKTTEPAKPYDRIYVAFYNGNWQFTNDAADIYPALYLDKFNPNHYFQAVDKVTDPDIGTLYLPELYQPKHFSSLGHGASIFDYPGQLTPDPNYLYEIEWLQTDGAIPNPRAIFLIDGMYYICQSIEAEFTPDGMSPLLKGEFYRVK